MSDRVCINQCTQRDVHYAACVNSSDAEIRKREAAEAAGEVYVAPCKGCAPRECRDGSLICDRCFGRIRHLLNETPDLIGRLESIADPRKATPTDLFRAGSKGILEAAAPVPADLLDALASVRAVLFVFEGWDSDLAKMSNDVEAIAWMCTMVLDRHQVVDGVREAWSIQDAIDLWGVERHDPREVEWEDQDHSEEVISTIGEWGERLLPLEEAAKRAGISLSTMRRLEAKGHVHRRALTFGERGKRTAWFYLSQVAAGIAAAEAARAVTKEKSA